MFLLGTVSQKWPAGWLVAEAMSELGLRIKAQKFGSKRRLEHRGSKSLSDDLCVTGFCCCKAKAVDGKLQTDTKRLIFGGISIYGKMFFGSFGNML